MLQIQQIRGAINKFENLRIQTHRKIVQTRSAVIRPVRSGFHYALNWQTRTQSFFKRTAGLTGFDWTIDFFN